MGFKNKKGAMDATNLILVGAVVLLVALQINPNLFAATGEDGVPTAQVIKVETDKACGSTTMTVDFEVAHKSGTDVTAQNATVFLNGAKKGVFSEGGTFTVNGGDELRVYNALDPAQTDYLASHSEGKVPCTGQTAAFVTSLTSYDGNDFMTVGSGSDLQAVGKIYESNSAATTPTILNDDFTTQPATAQAISTGQTRHITVKLFPVFEEGYGVADGSTLACRMTDADVDQSAVSISMNGKVLGDAKYLPSQTNFGVSATNQTTRYWHIPAIDGAVTSVALLDIGVKADDNKDPEAAFNFSCATFGTDYYEADDGSVKIDVEDRDDDSKIGRTAANELGADTFNLVFS